jgi:hypothetical protein
MNPTMERFGFPATLLREFVRSSRDAGRLEPPDVGTMVQLSAQQTAELTIDLAACFC